MHSISMDTVLIRMNTHYYGKPVMLTIPFDDAVLSLGEHRSMALQLFDSGQLTLAQAAKLAGLMRNYHQQGTLWTDINRLIETPLFVDSELTRMVQVADLCSYALRRYLENNEEDLFDKIFKRADRFHNTVVGVRHYSDISCGCKICIAHKAN